ncbi:hypothetical protein BVI1335_230007 [Burkholderia vietnamiensis]|nr:hypothetical protein BVI1335_230007 [Burkholderia vietnamiensis]
MVQRACDSILRAPIRCMHAILHFFGEPVRGACGRPAYRRPRGTGALECSFDRYGDLLP